MTRQKLVGWVLVVVSAAYLIYFVKTRLFAAGPYIDKREWFQVVGMVVTLMLGTINVRLAARRQLARNRQARQ